MTKTSNILADTLYITIKVIDRSLLESYDTCSHVETELEDIKHLLRETLDKLDKAKK